MFRPLFKTRVRDSRRRAPAQKPFSTELTTLLPLLCYIYMKSSKNHDSSNLSKDVMILANLHLASYRNYTELSCDLGAELNVVVGPNAQGKTNLLEAV